MYSHPKQKRPSTPTRLHESAHLPVHFAFCDLDFDLVKYETMAFFLARVTYTFHLIPHATAAATAEATAAICFLW